MGKEARIVVSPKLAQPWMDQVYRDFIQDWIDEVEVSDLVSNLTDSGLLQAGDIVRFSVSSEYKSELMVIETEGKILAIDLVLNLLN